GRARPARGGPSFTRSPCRPRVCPGNGAAARGGLCIIPANPAGHEREGDALMAEWQRTHTCGELREGNVGQAVVLNGWVNTYRAYNDQVFVDLRDRHGITQVVFEAEADKDLFAAAQEVRSEWVLSVRGKV